jgi:uncharacterized protein (DUF1015 family)
MEIRPYPVIHYPFDPELLSQVVCPPYDKVDNEQISHFQNAHPNNYIHAIIGESLADHAYHEKAAKTLHNWLKSGVLVQELSGKILVYRQRYSSPSSGEDLSRAGFFALLRLPERDKGDVLPHERTFAEHKADRLLLYRAVRGTPEAIFVLYSDPQGEVLNQLRKTETQVSFQDFHGHMNELALIDSPEVVLAIKSVVENQKLLIADGHHRFETGQNFRDECRAAKPQTSAPQPWDYILVYFTALQDPGLVILPTHRLVKGISPAQNEAFLSRVNDFFSVEEVEGTPSAALFGEVCSTLEASQSETLALASRNAIRLLRLRDKKKLKTLLPPDIAEPLRNLPLVWLHQILLGQMLGVSQEEGAPDRIGYVRTGEEVEAGLRKGGFDLAFLVRGTRPEEVQRVAESGHRMPQKSTDFYPKVLSGLAAYLYLED